MTKIKFIAVITFVIFIIGYPADALTLKESIDIAIKNQPAVVAAQKKLDAAAARLAQARGTFLPTIKLNADYSKSYTQPSTVQFSVGGVTQNYSFGTDATADTKNISASLTQPVFVAGLWPGLGIAQKSTDLAREEWRKTVQETAYNVTRAYCGVLMAREMVNLAGESKNMAQTHLNQVQTMFASGVVARTDLLRAEVQLANSEVALTKADNALEIAGNAFNNALGQSLTESVILAEDELSPKLDELPAYETILEMALASRPDWQEFQLNKQISADNLRVAQTAYLPTVMLSGTSGNRLTEYPSYKTDVNSWSIVGAASWTLFDGLGIQNRIREAGANLEAEGAMEAQMKNNLELEVRDAYLSCQSAQATIRPTAKALEAATENYKAANSRYRAGTGSNLEVIDSQVALTQAKINYLQAIFEIETARAKINKVVGREVL